MEEACRDNSAMSEWQIIGPQGQINEDKVLEMKRVRS